MAAKRREKKSGADSINAPPSSPTHRSDESKEKPLVDSDTVARKRKRHAPAFHIAGLAASAGGLDAFKKFFAAMPADSGVAFVLVPHLDPNHKSLLVELLSRHTTMPVFEVTDSLAVEANRVYILPPNKYMTISDGILRLRGPIVRGGLQTSIDLFLRSLAEDAQQKAVCIILSGTGSHGSLGLKEIKARNGMAMVQDPGTSEFPRMPESAIATGLADYVLPVEKMPQALIQYIRHDHDQELHAGADSMRDPDGVDDVLAILRSSTKFDFRCYRKRMLTRRIERRMSLGQIDRVADYVVFLRAHPDEVKRLFRDLLISVTSFFRDSEAFQALEADVIAPLIQAKDSDSPVRVWSAGCATGEESYSLAIMLAEQMTATQKSCPLQIFSTDVDEEALEIARQGIYPESIAADISAERLARFFKRMDDGSYQVSKQLRESVIFARQNLISDAPFSRLDLIVCRNVLIYLEPEIQQKLMSLLHFALNEGGFLFLGPSETIGRQIDMFEPVSKKWRIFRRLGPVRPDRVEVPITTGMNPIVPHRRVAEPTPARIVGFADFAQQLLLDEYAPPAVLINRKYEILYLFGAADRFLAVPAGEPTQDLMLLVRDGLSTKLRSAVHKALREVMPVELNDVQVKRNGDYYPVTVKIRPVRGPQGGDGLLLVTFQDTDQELPSPRPSGNQAEESIVSQLEYELKVTKEDLQGTIEALESSNEELKVSNEEVMSMNEELQSANEELETSKEELQSLNEELSTVNNQLQDKVADLQTANNDLANLLNCSEVAILFLDHQLRIKRFTPSATQVFNLIASDVNRPIGDITPKFDDSTLQQDLEHGLRTLIPLEKQVPSRTIDGRFWNRRISPYRTLDNRIEGIVLTFTDVTNIRHAANERQRLVALLIDSNDAVIVQDLDGKITSWNHGAERMIGYSEADAIQMNIERIIPDVDLRADDHTRQESLARGERVDCWESRRMTKDGRVIEVAVTASLLRGDMNLPDAIARTERDITQQKNYEDRLNREVRLQTEALRKSREELAAILRTAVDAIIIIDAHGMIKTINNATLRMFGYAPDELIDHNVSILMPSPFREEHDHYLEAYRQTGIKKVLDIGREVVGRRKDGSTFPAELAVSAVDHLGIFTGILRDLSKRKELEREVLEIASLEQRRIGQDLHDSVGQDLTALNILAGDLSEILHGNPLNEPMPSKETMLAGKIVQGLERMQKELRSVMQGLLPVAVDNEGLMAALADLADRTTLAGKVSCEFYCPNLVSISDNLEATHLYLIAQEAVHNAVKHAKCKHIRISLESNDELVVGVSDDGVGMKEKPTGKQDGLGMRIMQNRASIIGATLSVKSVQPTGTRITCALPRKMP